MAKFKKGDRVRQIMPAPFTGKIDNFTVDQETGNVQIRVTNKDENGDKNRRFFLEDQLELDPDAPAPAEQE